MKLLSTKCFPWCFQMIHSNIWLFKSCMFFVMLILTVTVLLLQSLSCHLYDLMRTMIKQLFRLVAFWSMMGIYFLRHMLLLCSWSLTRINCFSSINVTDLNVPSSIQLQRDFILTFWACLNFYDDMMKIYLILHSILESLHKSLEPQASTNQYDWQPIKKFKKYICIIQLKLNELCISIFKHMLERVFTFNSAKFLFLIPNQANCHDRYVIFQFITCNN